MSKTIALKGTKKGVISIMKLDEPYGKESGAVASIGISLSGEESEPEWKVHIPLFVNVIPDPKWMSSSMQSKSLCVLYQ